MIRFSELERKITEEGKSMGHTPVVSSGGNGWDFKVTCERDDDDLYREALFMIGSMLKEHGYTTKLNENNSGYQTLRFRAPVARRKPGFGVWYKW